MNNAANSCLQSTKWRKTASVKCITNVKHQTGCGRQRWGKSERKSGKTEGGREGGRETGAAVGPVTTGWMCVCASVCVCVLGGHSGEVGGMEEGIRALGPAPRGTGMMGREWRRLVGGRETG